MANFKRTDAVSNGFRTKKREFLLIGQDLGPETLQGCNSRIFAQHTKKSDDLDRIYPFNLTKNGEKRDKPEKNEEYDEIQI